MKQNIIFFWTNISWDMQDAVSEVCKVYDFIPKWQKGTGWSIGVFENSLDDANVLLEFIEGMDAHIIKQSKSRNDVQAKEKLRSSKIGELSFLKHDLQSPFKKKIIQLTIDDTLPSKEDIEAVEKKYRYKFTEDEIQKIEVEISNYINAFPTLQDYFLRE